MLVAGAVGLGLRPEMDAALEERAIGVDYLEIIAESMHRPLRTSCSWIQLA